MAFRAGNRQGELGEIEEAEPHEVSARGLERDHHFPQRSVHSARAHKKSYEAD